MDKTNSQQQHLPQLRHVREVAGGLAKKISQENSRRCPQCAVAQCQQGCPLGIDIPAFIRLLREGDASGALSVIRQQNPFPGLCGRVCSAPCETSCIFFEEGHPITIRELERYAADHGEFKEAKKKQNFLPGKKVAVIGAGPAGLTLAFILAKQGVSVVVFDACQDAGGLLRYAIPEFRLPQKTVDEMIMQVKEAGVHIYNDALFGRTLTLSELFLRGFNAVVLALGASVAKMDGIRGIQFSGAYTNIEFLTRLHQQGKTMALHHGDKLFHGNTTVVIAKTKDAFDTARMARRFNQQVTLCWTGPQEVLDKAKDMVKAALEEGVMLKEGVVLISIEGDEGAHVKGVLLNDLVEGEEILLPADTVIVAQGYMPNPFIRQHLPQLKFNEEATVLVDPDTGMTSVDKVFACGNIVIGPQPLVHAMAHAKRMAGHVQHYLELA